MNRTVNMTCSKICPTEAVCGERLLWDEKQLWRN